MFYFWKTLLAVNNQVVRGFRRYGAQVTSLRIMSRPAHWFCFVFVFEFFIWLLQSSIEFHGISHGSPGQHGIDKMKISVPWNSMELIDISFGGTRVPWNSMEYSIEHLCHLKWNSMELSYISFGGTRVPWSSMEYSMEFHGKLVSFEMAPSEFHGIPWNLVMFYLATPESHGIPWNIPCKSRITWYWVKWQSQSSLEFHGTKWYFIWRHQSSMEFRKIFHGIP